MSSRISKRKKSLAEKEAERAELREKNKRMSDQLAAMPRTTSMLERFTKWRVITRHTVCIGFGQRNPRSFFRKEWFGLL